LAVFFNILLGPLFLQVFIPQGLRRQISAVFILIGLRAASSGLQVLCITLYNHSLAVSSLFLPPDGRRAWRGTAALR
jgi:hypothetical protein